MVYGAALNGEMIFFSDWASALQAHKEIGLGYFFPREGNFSLEEQKDVIAFLDGEWKTIPITDLDNMECTCGGGS
jgi:hypothetical protein